MAGSGTQPTPRTPGPPLRTHAGRHLVSLHDGLTTIKLTRLHRDERSISFLALQGYFLGVLGGRGQKIDVKNRYNRRGAQNKTGGSRKRLAPHRKPRK